MIPKNVDRSKLLPTEFVVLYDLTEIGLFSEGKVDCQINEIEKRTGLSRSTISRALMNLDERKIITKQYDARRNCTYIYPCQIIHSRGFAATIARLMGIDDKSVPGVIAESTNEQVLDAALTTLITPPTKIKDRKRYFAGLCKKELKVDKAITSAKNNAGPLPSETKGIDVYDYLYKFPLFKELDEKRGYILEKICGVESIVKERERKMMKEIFEEKKPESVKTAVKPATSKK